MREACMVNILVASKRYVMKHASFEEDDTLKRVRGDLTKITIVDKSSKINC